MAPTPDPTSHPGAVEPVPAESVNEITGRLDDMAGQLAAMIARAEHAEARDRRGTPSAHAAAATKWRTAGYIACTLIIVFGVVLLGYFYLAFSAALPLPAWGE